MLASCSSEEPFGGDNSGSNEELVTNYISVNIIPASGLGTRADNDKSPDGLYRDGEESENKVNMVRFYFFDENGNATPVRATGETSYESYLDWYPSAADNQFGGPQNNETVEKTFKTTLGIFVPDGDQYKNPASVIAVINPSEQILKVETTGTDPNVAGPSITDLKACIEDFKNGLVDGNFVMSNSVYADDQKVEYMATSLVKDDPRETYFKASIEAAIADPVTIYVERVVARLDLWIDLEGGVEKNGVTLYPLTVVDPATGATSTTVTIDGVPTSIYIKFLGWNITGATEESNLMKHINKDWTSTELFGANTPNAWTIPAFHRSFWAMNPQDVQIQFGNFNGQADLEDNPYPATGLLMPEKQNYRSVYLQENASPFDTSLAPSYPTKVILACQLVDADGNEIELAEWGFRKFLKENLKSYLLGVICKDNNFYYKKKGENTTSFTSLGVNDLTFISAAEKFNVQNGVYPEGVKSYYSYLVLTDEASEYDWYIGEGEGAEETTAEEINKYLFQKVNYSMVWNNGNSYYFFDVHHLGNEGSVGYNGIVRNHIYDTHVKSIIGIGTPVVNPNETIYPEKPEYEEAIIAAEVKILQWRVVRSDYEIQW